MFSGAERRRFVCPSTASVERTKHAHTQSKIDAQTEWEKERYKDVDGGQQWRQHSAGSWRLTFQVTSQPVLWEMSFKGQTGVILLIVSTTKASSLRLWISVKPSLKVTYDTVQVLTVSSCSRETRATLLIIKKILCVNINHQEMAKNQVTDICIEIIVSY